MSTTVSPGYVQSWDSMEGIPQIGAPPSRPPAATGLSGAGHAALGWVGERLAGVALAAGLGWLAALVAGGSWWARAGFARPPVNAIPVAILLGILICNTIGVPEVFRQGLRACMVQLLRLAIILLGLRLSLGAVGTLGFGALPIVVACVAVALIAVPWLGERIGLSRRLGTLIAVGTSICGVSAIMAIAPAIKAEDDEVAYAVGCVALFGVVAMLAYPFVAPVLLGSDARSIGVFFGTAIHDTTQVTAAAFAYQEMHHAPEALNAATVTKIVRNLAMVAVVPLMAMLHHRARPEGKDLLRRWHHVVPLFVLGFLALSILRTIGDASSRPFGFLEPATWSQVIEGANVACVGLLTVVMAAVGLNTSLTQLRRLGGRPFVAGLIAALIVGVVSVLAIKVRAGFGG